jgi:hypothetical protein
MVEFDKNRWSGESMKYLGVAKKKGPSLEMPDCFEGKVVPATEPFEVVSTGEVERLARKTIEEHRKTLEALAR